MISAKSRMNVNRHILILPPGIPVIYTQFWREHLFAASQHHQACCSISRVTALFHGINSPPSQLAKSLFRAPIAGAINPSSQSSIPSTRLHQFRNQRTTATGIIPIPFSAFQNGRLLRHPRSPLRSLLLRNQRLLPPSSTAAPPGQEPSP